MRFLLVGLLAVSAWAVDVASASAAWDNVFQPTLFGRCRTPSTSNYYAPPVVVSSSPIVSYSVPASNCTTCQSPPPSQPQCTTSYTQRCYYQPVTTMETRSYYESVTTQQKSYYYEPVTTYRYSSYYDPCTCCYQQVATPVTSYQLREKCCPVQSWVQRCVQVPVTTSQKVCYWQPQTTCCQTTQGAPIYSDTPPPSTSQPLPPVNTAPSIGQPPPNVNTDRTPGNNTSSNPMYDRFYPPQQTIAPAQTPPPPAQTPTMPPAGTSWQPRLGAPSPIVPQPRPQPSVKLDSIVVGPDSRVDGTVVRADSSPRANAKMLFVNAGTGQRATVNANSAGRFNAELPTGTWLVYLYNADDVPTYHTQVNVANSQNARLTLVSRSN